MICAIIAGTFVAVILVVWAYGVIDNQIRNRRYRRLRQPGFPVVSRSMHWRLLCYLNNNQIDPDTNIYDDRSKAEASAAELLAKGYQVFIVETDGPDGSKAGRDSDGVRVVEPFHG